MSSSHPTYKVIQNIMDIKNIVYKGVDCLQVSNDTIQLIISIGIGPRILFYGFKQGNNFFKIFEDQLKDYQLDHWQSYGGHRLWHAPEMWPRTYEIDNKPIEYDVQGNIIHLKAPFDSETKIEKEIRITIPMEGSRIELAHTLRNRNIWNVELAAWSLSVMAPQGRAIIPQEPFIPHSERLTPARPIVLWHYTKMNDPRLVWGEKYIQIRADQSINAPLKIGILNKQGWIAYAMPEGLFIKYHDYQDNMTYPDYQSNAEIYTEPGFLEIETLSPLTHLDPNQTLAHQETWELFPIHGEMTDAEIEKNILQATKGFTRC